VTAIRLIRRGNPAGWAFVLFLASGYAAQLSTHLLTGLIALWLLTWNLREGERVSATSGTTAALKPSPLAS
jgi:hypothetical protein